MKINSKIKVSRFKTKQKTLRKKYRLYRLSMKINVKLNVAPEGRIKK